MGATTDGAPRVVGGVQIGPSPVEGGEAAASKRKRGRDGRGVVRKRTCLRCRAWGEEEQGKRCPGRGKGGRSECDFFEMDPGDPDPEEDEFGEGEEDGREEGEE